MILGGGEPTREPAPDQKFDIFATSFSHFDQLGRQTRLLQEGFTLRKGGKYAPVPGGPVVTTGLSDAEALRALAERLRSLPGNGPLKVRVG